MLKFYLGALIWSIISYVGIIGVFGLLLIALGVDNLELWANEFSKIGGELGDDKILEVDDLLLLLILLSYL